MANSETTIETKKESPTVEAIRNIAEGVAVRGGDSYFQNPLQYLIDQGATLDEIKEAVRKAKLEYRDRIQGGYEPEDSDPEAAYRMYYGNVTTAFNKWLSELK